MSATWDCSGSTTGSARGGRQLVADGHLLVDVRSRRQWEHDHVEGSVNIPLNELEERAGELPEGVPLVTICSLGGQSAVAAGKLSRLGRKVTNSRGGMFAWRRTDQRIDKTD